MRRLWEAHRVFLGWAMLVAVVLGAAYLVTGSVTLGLAALVGWQAQAVHELTARIEQLENRRKEHR